MSNDGIHDSMIDIDLETLAVIEKMMVHVKINFALDKNDKTYQREFFQTSVDVKRLQDGVQGSFVIKMFLENFYKSIDFEPKFPLKKVRKISIISFKENLILASF